MMYDVIIIGAGPAAWTATIFLVRAGFSVLVVGQDEMSGLADATEVGNYPGFPEGISGRILLDHFIEQGKKHGATFEHGEVTHAQQEGEKKFVVKTADFKEFRGSALILAHGANYIKANLPGEREFVGRGVHYCSLCDGPLYKGKKVLVLGNASYAAEEALELAGYVGTVKIISQSLDFSLSLAYEKAIQEKKIELVKTRVKKIEGQNGRFTSVVLSDDAKESADAIFIALGVASSIAFAQKLGLELNGDFIKVDGNLRTSLDNVWAVGMARGGVNQIVKSVGDGGVAAVDAIKKLKGLPSYIDHT